MNIQKFTIHQLHNTLDYNLTFHDNKLILVGENGSSKTTVMKLLFYTLSSQWLKLLDYNFKHLTLSINDQEITILHEDLKALEPHAERTFNRRRHMRLSKYRMALKWINPSEQPVLADILNEEWEDSDPIIETIKKLKTAREILVETIKNTHIMYLPTYRRIEDQLSIVLNMPESEVNDIIEAQNAKNDTKEDYYSTLVKFGMNDVIESINNSLAKLKEHFSSSLNNLTLGYLGDVVNKLYEKKDVQPLETISETEIEEIINRVEDKILSSKDKSALILILKKRNEEDVQYQVVSHYFQKLNKAHQELVEKETQIKKFTAVCDKYLANKEAVYTSTSFTFKITSKDKEIDVNQLSSGEKQIISLFSHLYLDDRKKYFILIDEPELSLSVVWQKAFLPDIIAGGYCEGLVAVTHSPFIFENNLEKYTHGISEFTNKL